MAPPHYACSARELFGPRAEESDPLRAIRRELSEGAKGKIIESLEWDAEGEGGGYWVMTFTDGSETCWSRNMAEIR